MSLKSVLSKIVPAVGSIVGSVVPGAGAIISGVASLFGADPSNPDDIAAKIKQDPQAYLKLVQFEKDHEAEILSIQAKDRQNARMRELEMVKTTGKRDWVVSTLALAYTFGFFALLFVIIFVNVPDNIKSVFDIIFGAVSSGEGLILAYFFGSMNQPISAK